jgi:hypothetical protein
MKSLIGADISKARGTQHSHYAVALRGQKCSSGLKYVSVSGEQKDIWN